MKEERSLQQLFRTSESAADRVLPLAEIYRQRGIDMFAWPGANLVGRQLPPATKPGNDFSGHWQVEKVFATMVQPAARFTARCLTHSERQVPDYVVISQPDGEAVGLGRAISGGRFKGYISNYSPDTDYQCHPVLKGKLERQSLPRNNPTSYRLDGAIQSETALSPNGPPLSTNCLGLWKNNAVSFTVYCRNSPRPTSKHAPIPGPVSGAKRQTFPCRTTFRHIKALGAALPTI